MISAFIAAIGNAAEVIQSKAILKNHHLSARKLQVLGSLLIFLVLLPVFFIWGQFYVENINSLHIVLFFAVIFIGFIYNYLYYYALKKGELCDVEPLAMLTPITAMIIAVIFYPDERNFFVFILGLIAAITLIFTRVKKHHFKMKKATAAMLGFVFLFSIEINLIKGLLEVFNPISLYTIRIGILALLFQLFSPIKYKEIKRPVFWNTLLLALVVAIEMAFYYQAISTVGVVLTSLIMLLAPVVIIGTSRLFFKEKLTLKKIFSSTIVLICVAIAIMVV